MTEAPVNGNGFRRGGAVLNKEQFEARLQVLVENAIASRTEFINRMADPRRNLDADCGYPQPNELTPWFYRDLFDREPVAERVVSLMPRECWQVSPQVYESEDADDVTPFEEAWDNLSKQLRGSSSYFQDEEGSPIWEFLHRVDKLSGIGSFGILLLGFDDGRPLHEPLEGLVSKVPVGNAHEESHVRVSYEEVEYSKRFHEGTGKLLTTNLARPSTGGQYYRDGQLLSLSSLGTEAQYLEPKLGDSSEYPAVKPYGKERKLNFIRAFDHSLVQVSTYESNMLHPRFGQPTMYRVTLNDPREFQGVGAGLSLATVQVHWSRVIHVADNLNASEVFGAPRMRPVVNPILDIRKVRGAGAEGYWNAGLPGLAISTHPQLGGDVPVDESSFKDMMENYRHTLQRYLLLVGMDAKTIGPSMVDPTPYVNVLTEAICVQIGVPVRVFRGSERGELASSQDDSSWNDRLRHRQNSYVTPRIIVPFVDRLIQAGVLPVPKAKKVDYEGRLRSKKLSQESKGGEAGAVPGQPKGQFPGKGAPVSPSVNRYLYNKDGEVVGVETRGGYSITWPDLDSLSEKDRATIFSTYMTGLAAYVSGGIENLVPPKSMLTHFAEFDEEEAQAIMDEGFRHQEEQLDIHEDLAERAEEQDLVKTPPTGFEEKPEPPPTPIIMGGGGPQAGKFGQQPPTGKKPTTFPPKSPTENAYTFDAEDCPKCGASMEGDPSSGKCNACGYRWGKEITENCGGEGGTMGPCPGGGKGNKAARGVVEGMFPGLKVKEGYRADVVDRALFAAGSAIKGATKAMVAKAGEKIKAGYGRAVERYGRAGAAAMFGAMAVTFPIPGNVFGVIAAAEGIKRLTGNAEDDEDQDVETGTDGGGDRPDFLEMAQDAVELAVEAHGALGLDLPEDVDPVRLARLTERKFDRQGESVENSNPEGCNQYKDCGDSSSQESGSPVGKLRAISDEFAKYDGPVSREKMRADVDAVLAGLSKGELKEAAAAFGSRSAKGREGRAEAIKRFISDRREMLQRTKTH
jgi:hypothetical protein